MRPSARALATDVDPHALLSQCFLAAVLSKLGNPVGKYVLGSILNAALSEDCKDLPMQGLSTRSFNAKTTMFTCAPELEPISAARLRVPRSVLRLAGRHTFLTPTPTPTPFSGLPARP